jgi:AcrR family transcriptional regulator
MVSFSAAIDGSGAVAPGLRRFSPRQKEVLDVIETVFLREGIRGVRMGQLADEAGCSRSTLYELAPSREDLLLLVLDRMMRRIEQRGAEAIAAAEDPVARVRAMLTSGALDFATLGPGFLDAVRHHPPARLLFDRRIAEGRDALETLIEQARSPRRWWPRRCSPSCFASRTRSSPARRGSAQPPASPSSSTSCSTGCAPAAERQQVILARI